MSRKWVLVLVSFVAVAAIVGIGVWVLIIRQETPPVAPERLTINGKEIFLTGVNYPWHNYQDFGSGPWGHSGISDPTSYAEVDTDFANMAAQGIKVVKWRVFNDGRYDPQFDKRGYATGFDDKFFADVDAALEIAQKHDIYLILGLFSSGLWTTDCESNGVHLGYGPGILSDNSRRQSLIKNAVVPFLQHIGHNEQVLAYEIFIEPEWGINELRDPKSDRKTVPLSKARSFVKDAVKAVHEYTGALAAVQSNRPTYMRNWRGLGLDYYSFSWYDWMEPYDPLDVAPSTYKLDKPTIVGEFPVSGSQYYSFTQVVDTVYNQHYGGAFAWSYNAGDKYSNWSDIAKNYTAWVSNLWPEVDLTGSSPVPSPNAPLEPQPYVYYDPQVVTSTDSVDVSVDLQIREGGTYILKFYLYEFGGSPPGTELQQVAMFMPGERQQFDLSFPNLVDGQRYKMSVGIYSSKDTLAKWIDSYAVFDVKNGNVEFPNLSDEVVGNPCSK